MHKLARAALIALSAVTIGSFIPAQDARAASVSDIVTEALAIANDDTHGYSQSDRWGPDYDCSSFVITALKKAGFSTGGATCSSDIVSCLTSVGFIYIQSGTIDFSDYDDLVAGDILVADGHVEIYAGNGKRIGAHSDYDGVTGDSSGKEICVKSYYNGNWKGVLRYSQVSVSALATETAVSSSDTSSSDSDSGSKSSSKSGSSSSGYKTGTYKTKVSLYVRKGPGKSYKVKSVVSKGKKVKVTKVKNGWGKIKTKKKSGWVSLNLCKSVK